MKVTAVAPFASRGNKKLNAELIATAAGNEASAIGKISGRVARVA